MIAAPATRRALIRELLLDGAAATQDELRQALRKRSIRVSQPVLSRDLQALGAIKQNGAYALAATERVTPLDSLRPLLRSVREAGNLVVILSEPGSASAIARALEAEQIDGVAGTLAGDDTVFVAVAHRKCARAVRERVAALL